MQREKHLLNELIINGFISEFGRTVDVTIVISIRRGFMGRIVIQRVLKASVVSGGETVGQIGQGLMVLVGIGKNDTEKDVEFLVKKMLNLQLWSDTEEGERWQVMNTQNNIPLMFCGRKASKT